LTPSTVTWTSSPMTTVSPTRLVRISIVTSLPLPSSDCPPDSSQSAKIPHLTNAQAHECRPFFPKYGVDGSFCKRV